MNNNISEIIDNPNHKKIFDYISNSHISDVAITFSNFSFEQKKIFLEHGLEHLDPVFFSKISPPVFEDAEKIIGLKKIAKLISLLESFEAIELISDLNPVLQEKILTQISKKLQKDVAQSLNYPEESVARIMHHNVITVPIFWNLAQVRNLLKEKQDLLNFYVNGVIIVDHLHKAKGVLSFANLLKHDDEIKIKDLLETEHTIINYTKDFDDLATDFQKYNLNLAAVTDDNGRLLGGIYINDVTNVIAETSEDDLLHLGGVNESDIFANNLKTIKSRLPWLVINLFTAILASIVIYLFDDTIKEIVALAVLMPIIASMGGNAGTQTVTIAIRALATNSLNDTNHKKIIFKEFLIGSINGLVFGLVCMITIFFIYNDLALALLFALATIITLTVAGLTGILIPLLIDKIKFDPATSSGVILTTATDVIAFLTFLGLANIFLV